MLYHHMLALWIDLVVLVEALRVVPRILRFHLSSPPRSSGSICRPCVLLASVSLLFSFTFFLGPASSVTRTAYDIRDRTV